MLESLKIKNIALIKSQSLELTRGLNVLTGETGAGKSLIIDSLSLLLGEKADKSLISRGEREASVEAVFSFYDSKVVEILQELGLEDEGKIVITRKLSQDGKNEIRVNGNAFTLSMLKKLSAPLMDLHGQFEHQNLLKVSSHLKILDAFGGNEISKKLSDYKKTYDEYVNIERELKGYEVDDRERNRTMDLLAFQIEEIDNAAFYEGEEEELKAYRNQVLHAERISEALTSASGMVSGDGYGYSGMTDNIKKVIATLGSLSAFFDKVNPLIDRLSSAKLELEDIAETLDQMKDELYVDQGKAEENEKRLDLLSSFKKKYGSSIEEINKYREEIGKKYDNLNNSIERVQELKNRISVLEVGLVKNAKSLTEERKKYAKIFETRIKTELSDLGMKNSSFVVKFQDLGLEGKTKDGFDKVEFMFSANLGEEVKPLKSVASGGEMSRFMLAVKNVTASIEGVGTLVFDEIDTGVSGVIALKLAEKLSRVSKMAQVICVTHLAQIASYGDNHFVIEKTEAEGRTVTSVHAVSGAERENEIARLISGNMTEHSLSHARELLQNAQNFKQN